MAETFFGVSMILMNYKDEVRQIKSELSCFLGHPTGSHQQEKNIGHICQQARLYLSNKQGEAILVPFKGCGYNVSMNRVRLYWSYE